MKTRLDLAVSCAMGIIYVDELVAAQSVCISAECLVLKVCEDMRLYCRWSKQIQWTRATLTCPPLMEALLID